MKKSVFAILTAASLIPIAAVPSAFAANSDYVGSYVAYEIDGNGHAVLNITECSDSAVTLEFSREKNNAQPFIYTIEPGTMAGTDGTLKFNAVNSAGVQIPGTMTLTLLSDRSVKIHLVSDQGQTYYAGIMTPSQNIPPVTAQPPAVQPPAEEKDITILVNGEAMTFAEDVKPSIINDHTYVPLRSVFTNMGINVFWDDFAKNDVLFQQLITCTKNNTIVQFSRTRNNTDANTWILRRWVDKCTDGTETDNIDIAELQPVIIGESSYIPLRIVSESFGAEVDWDGDTRTVIINCDVYNQYQMDADTIARNEDCTATIARSYITPDYTSVYSNNEPYFAPQGKFYKFDAQDQWNNVVLRIFTGGYIDVFLTDSYSSTQLVPPPPEQPVETLPEQPEETAPDTVEADTPDTTE